MVLSYARAKRSDMDFETLLRERLLQPLGMSDTYIIKRRCVLPRATSPTP
jgi:CubicO group peptidase (beta-lactamase class C family)